MRVDGRGRTHAASTQEGGAPATVVGIDAEAMEDGRAGIAEARVGLHQVGPVRHLVELGAPPVATAINDHRRVSEKTHVADAGGELDVAVGGPATARPPLVVAVDARGRVVDRPQTVAAVAAGIVGEPGPGEEFAPQGDGIRRGPRRVLNRPRRGGRHGEARGQVHGSRGRDDARRLRRGRGRCLLTCDSAAQVHDDGGLQAGREDGQQGDQDPLPSRAGPVLRHARPAGACRCLDAVLPRDLGRLPRLEHGLTPFAEPSAGERGEPTNRGPRAQPAPRGGSGFVDHATPCGCYESSRPFVLGP